MPHQTRSPDRVYTPYEGPKGKSYEQVVISEGTRFVHVAGTIPKNEAGELVGVDDMEAQIECVLENIDRSLEAAGCDPSDVVRTNSYTTDIDRYIEHADLLVEYFDQRAGTVVGVEELAPTFSGVADGEPTDVDPEYLVEIEVTAVTD